MVGGVIICTMQRFPLFLTTSLFSALSLSWALSWAPLAYGQTTLPNDILPKGERPDCESGVTVLRIPEGGGAPIYSCESFGEQQGGSELGDTEKPETEEEAKTLADDEADIIPEGTEDSAAPEKPDYSQLSAAAEREAKLTDLFAKLKDEDNAEDANLIAEEIWVIWLDSGSPSINLVLRRGSDAVVKEQRKKARRMFDNVTSLQPDFAEGWARSSRLALEEKDFSRALTEAVRTLSLEPRHFYALWTLGNAFERLGRQEEALEAYREANALYPELAQVKERLKALEAEVEGDVL